MITAEQARIIVRAWEQHIDLSDVMLQIEVCAKDGYSITNYDVKIYNSQAFKDQLRSLGFLVSEEYVDSLEEDSTRLVIKW